MNRFLLCGLAAGGLTIGAGSARALDWTKSQVTVTVPVGTPSVTVHYPFTNHSKSEVHILEIQTSCGCTVASTHTMDVPAEGTGTIDAVFTTGDHLGRQSKIIYVRADDAPRSTELGLVVFIGGEHVAAPPSGK